MKHLANGIPRMQLANVVPLDITNGPNSMQGQITSSAQLHISPNHIGHDGNSTKLGTNIQSTLKFEYTPFKLNSSIPLHSAMLEYE